MTSATTRRREFHAFLTSRLGGGGGEGGEISYPGPGMNLRGSKWGGRPGASTNQNYNPQI